MNILTEIYRRPGINVNGKTIYRTAVRGVILHGRSLLMIYSSHVGDYKFPGGGINQGETPIQALNREIQEECGMSVTHIGMEIGAVVEYSTAMEHHYDVFKMTSHYYLCDVKDGSGIQELDDYEQDLGFQPVWIDIEHAIQGNQALLNFDKTPEWLKREIFVLEYLRQNILLTPGT